jgi:hypothetical protein
VAQKALYEELGYTDASELKDRYYFHSMYVRAPGGILVECTATVPDGFYLDEAPGDLGKHLKLPPWYEDQRAAHPGAARADSRAGGEPAVSGVVAAAPGRRARAGGGLVMSRTRADFTTRGEASRTDRSRSAVPTS